LKNGGLVCESCYSPIQIGPNQELLTISDDCIKLWRFLAENKLELAPKLKLTHKLIKELSNLVNSFLSFRD
jgi:hypothetical protein